MNIAIGWGEKPPTTLNMSEKRMKKKIMYITMENQFRCQRIRYDWLLCCANLEIQINLFIEFQQYQYRERLEKLWLNFFFLLRDEIHFIFFSPSFYTHTHAHTCSGKINTMMSFPRDTYALNFQFHFRIIHYWLLSSTH